MIEYSEVLLRLILALLSGGLVGLQREAVHKPAGMRTHMLVSVGSALFVIVTLQTIPHDTGRIIAGIATGIGFLGAGTIFKAKNDVHGLTTAASIWSVAALGLAFGMGLYQIAITAAVIILLILGVKKLNYNKKK